ncbi:hypothetical protein PVAND_010470 [Polypedilum vanderplanki]|uniref:alkaline phosphatase n=1 Tax=Polypedilum vanderplanki TaxID=319348 RepID=A0A9J6CGP5_POLVA|nr:hypothetical protein PVAND_010470 [Polypedilum vanderplanki]
MKALFLLLGIISLGSCIVFDPPNKGETKYWHDYNMKFLKKVLNSQKPLKVAKNVILFVGDGMSFATITAGRILKGQMEGKSGEESEFIFEDFPHIGLAKTYGTNVQITDSALTATAIFSGIKTSFFAIGANNPTQNVQEKDRLKNIIDWAQEKGKRTGVVTNTKITDATPASAYAYSFSRLYECDSRIPENVKSIGFKNIAKQLVENEPGNKLNVIFGGGRDYLGVGSGKFCNNNLVTKYLNQFDNEKNVKFVKNTGELRAVDFSDVDHIMGLFADDHMDYESLRKKDLYGQPSLSEMTQSAIQILNNKYNENGFVLIIEGGLIDKAHHFNQAKFALEELVEMEKAIQIAKNMTSSEDTLIIVTADHAHSMLFHGYPSRGNDILGFANEGTNVPLFETLVYGNGPGYRYHLIKGSQTQFMPMENYTVQQRKDPSYMYKSMIPLDYSTHSGEDVGVYADGPGSFLIQRVFEQCYIGYAISVASCIG